MVKNTIRGVFLAGVLFLGYTLFSPSPQHKAFVWPENVVQAHKDTVVIISVGTAEGISEGAGVVIQEDGLILTAAHLFDRPNIDYIQVYARNKNYYRCDLLAIDFRKDLALVRPKRSAQTFKAARLGTTTSLEKGQKIMVVGHPYWYYYDEQYGTVLRIIHHLYYFGEVLFVSAIVRPGNSGGPVFNEKGHVVGVVSARVQNPATEEFQYGIAISINEINAFLVRSRILLKYSRPQIKRYRLGGVR